MEEARFYTQLDKERVKCELCPRDCTILPGEVGSCNVRKNESGKLIALTYGVPCSMAVDPVEKKPLYHFHPGKKIFSVATLGCNLFCKWCQNSSISHPEDVESVKPYGEMTPEYIIELCKKSKCDMIAFTYTEPTVFYEYMIDIAKIARKEGIKTVMVSNGYIHQKPLMELLPYIDTANIDLKMFDGKNYLKWTSAQLDPVLDTIKTIAQSDTHLELTTLIVPGVNDSAEELEKMYAWIEEQVGRDAIVHISRFYPHYKTQDKEPTPLESLTLAFDVAQRHVNYAYVGNVAPSAATHDTVCPKCSRVLIERSGRIIKAHMTAGVCECGNKIPGNWAS